MPPVFGQTFHKVLELWRCLLRRLHVPELAKVYSRNFARTEFCCIPEKNLCFTNRLFLRQLNLVVQSTRYGFQHEGNHVQITSRHDGLQQLP